MTPRHIAFAIMALSYGVGDTSHCLLNIIELRCASTPSPSALSYATAPLDGRSAILRLSVYWRLPPHAASTFVGELVTLSYYRYGVVAIATLQHAMPRHRERHGVATAIVVAVE